MIWARAELRTIQIISPSPDITAASIRVEDRVLLVVAMSIPPSHHRTQEEAAQDLFQRLGAIKEILQSARTKYREEPELVTAGDFNRHCNAECGSASR
jgi:hypothetical protein